MIETRYYTHSVGYTDNSLFVVITSEHKYRIILKDGAVSPNGYNFPESWNFAEKCVANGSWKRVTRKFVRDHVRMLKAKGKGPIQGELHHA